MEELLTLRQLLGGNNRFLLGAELVTTRGSINQPQSQRIARLAMFLSEFRPVHFVSITDNPGGSVRISPENLGADLAYRGKNVIIHLTCKDLNRNGLESRAWQLASMGLENVLALSGDYPVEGYQGVAQGVFDLDSIGLIRMLRDMNDGLKIVGRKGGRQAAQTNFLIGAAVTNFKRFENEVMPQYLKLEKKIRTGARFIITQMGYDSQKFHELVAYCRYRGLNVPLIANVFVLSADSARAFNSGRITGCVVTDELLALAERAAASPDKGKRFFLELAAKQIAVARGLGYSGAYIGGLHEPSDFEQLLQIADGLGPGDWTDFAREIRFSQPGEFFLFERVPDTGLVDPTRISRSYLDSIAPARREAAQSQVETAYRLHRWVHDHLFAAECAARVPAEGLYRILEKSDMLAQAAHKAEHAAKRLLFDCRDCGDCSLPEIAYLCPESQCAKNQRNGPCGGTRQGLCEAVDKLCIWSRAYDRLKPFGREADFVERDPVIKNGSLDKTSAWANYFLGRDHNAKPNKS